MSQAIQPVIGKNVYIAETAYVAGDVAIGDDSTVMHQVVIRADIASIRIGKRVNVQDGAILHTATGESLDIADDVGIGHRAVVHCTSVGRRTLIGIGALLLDGAEIGSECVIAAGSLVTPWSIIPDGSVVMGVPGRIVRESEPRDFQMIDHVVQSYIRMGRQHAAGRYPNIAPSPPNS